MKSASELAALLGVNEATLRLWRAEAGIPAKARNVGYTEDEEARIREIAANKRKGKPRKGNDSAITIARIEASPEMRAIIAEKVKRDDDIAQTANDISAFDSALLGDYTRFDGMYTAQLDRIESMLHALMALLEKAAIAPRYIPREELESALTTSSGKLPAVAPADLPPGTVRLKLFAALHNVNHHTLYDQADVGKFSVTKRNYGASDGRQENWLTPLQQAQVIRYWRSAGFKHAPCEDCPHEPQDEIERQSLIEADTDLWAQRLPLPEKETQE